MWKYFKSVMMMRNDVVGSKFHVCVKSIIKKYEFLKSKLFWILIYVFKRLRKSGPIELRCDVWCPPQYSGLRTDTFLNIFRRYLLAIINLRYVSTWNNCHFIGNSHKAVKKRNEFQIDQNIKILTLEYNVFKLMSLNSVTKWDIV